MALESNIILAMIIKPEKRPLKLCTLNVRRETHKEF